MKKELRHKIEHWERKSETWIEQAGHHIKQFFKHGSIAVGIIVLVIAGVVFIWIGTLKVPDLGSFDTRKVPRSTKIYDKTGEIVLFDVNKDLRRTLVPAEEISVYAKNAIVGIEDEHFYQHHGIELKDTARALLANITKGSFSQGGSTITQQVIKNTLLVQDKKISRKLKEWFLAMKIEKKLTKDEILTHYLNAIPYGGSIYGIEEASRTFFGKSALDVSLTEAAYLAAIPNAPTYYSPYGQHKDALDRRKNLVLQKMLELGFITQEEYDTAKAEEVTFIAQDDNSAKALHFVQYIRAYLEERYGTDAVETEGLRVTTTLDYDLQQVAEKAAKENALKNETDWNAENQGVVVIDAKTGQILTMVGSRDYFDKEIDGNFNVTLGKRQPGSSFKPFVYATAFKKGYTDKTVVFDTRTQFETSCAPTNFTNEGACYSPANYDGLYKGPINLRNALAQSRNVPSVMVLYLAGIDDSIRTAKNMGISTLTTGSRYGLTLVLGGGEVTLVDMTSAYSVFATGGVRNPATGILKVEDADGNILEEYRQQSEQVLDRNVALTVSSILSDNVARTPLFGPTSFLYFGNRDVAGKTGTTNDNRDAWLVGYSPDVVVGVWSGNNDNTPMKKGSAISGPTWRTVMDAALRKYPASHFEAPEENPEEGTLRPVLRGEWEGGDTYTVDTISRKLATDLTPPETRKEVAITNPHSILHWVDKNNPLGPIPANPASDNQYERWEWGVRNWVLQNMPQLYNTTSNKPTTYDDIHVPENAPNISIVAPLSGEVRNANTQLTAKVTTNGKYPVERVNYFVNNSFVGSSTNKTNGFAFSFVPNEIANLEQNNELKAIAIDSVYNRGEGAVQFKVN